jgi:16S rRNA (uracil1498-N3)-methyltransferase
VERDGGAGVSAARRVERAQVATFAAPSPLIGGASVALGEDAAHHMRVRRLEPGVRVRLLDGEGRVGEGILVRVTKGGAVVDLDRVETRDPLPPVHLLVPVADRDRMLWLAEKCAELALTSWRPVLWRRSRSVTPRGEGPGFQQKVRARMLQALAQSEGAWLPTLYPDATAERAIAATPDGTRLVLDPDGEPLAGATLEGPVTLALGPEGGLEPDEHDRLVAGGFAPVSVGGNILRLETAGIAALAVVRAVLAADGAANGAADRPAG